MRTGNEAFKSGRLSDAERHYLSALQRFEHLELLPEQSDDRLICLIANHHNLAELYQRCSDQQRALQHLMEPHRRVLGLMSDARGNHRLLQNASRAMRYTLPPLMSFARSHPLCDDCMSMLQRSQQWLGAGTTYH